MSYSSGTGLTTISGPFGAGIGGVLGSVSVAAGDVIVPNLHQPVALHIDSYSSGSVTVIGDVTAFVAVDDWFRIHIKSHHNYNPDDEDKWFKRTGCEYGARYLWSGYRRIPWTTGRAGEEPYHTWNRWYLPGIGRWTSPDPAMTPWGNLMTYVRGNPLKRRDLSGLDDDWLIPMSGSDLKKLKDPKNSFPGKYEEILHGPGQGNTSKYHWHATKGKCTAYDEVRSSGWGTTGVTWGTDIHWCCKLFRRKCEVTLELVRDDSFDFSVKLVVGKASKAGQPGGGPGTPGYDDADLFEFNVSVPKGSQVVARLNDVTVYLWKKKCHCFQEEFDDCDWKTSPCDSVSIGQKERPQYWGFSSDPDEVKDLTGHTGNGFGDYIQTLDWSKRPTELGGDCTTALGL